MNIGIIPARWASTRFPGKPLVEIAGKPLLLRVYENALRARRLDQVIIATDDDRIYQAALAWGARVFMTSPAHPTGSDRLAEVARKLPRSRIIVNIQGDEPLLKPAVIDALVGAMHRDRTVPVATVARTIDRTEELENPNVVKVVFDRHGHALYFSRHTIPFVRDAQNAAEARHYKHLGLYAYRRHYLLKFVKMKPGKLENIEKLEQLRILENGDSLRVVLTSSDSIGVDTPADAARVEKLLTR
ncbi:MAG: 3-deoxy-manno-octulosonate cytidylyltransferase [Verrucomicrobiae bacterium]|nr:3-deoxy-manno-octulosonate cytidylyltransferase [Verrucomicrobiae bacterium]